MGIKYGVNPKNRRQVRLHDVKKAVSKPKLTRKGFVESPVVKELGLNFKVSRKELKQYEKLSKEVEVIRERLDKQIDVYEDKDVQMSKSQLTVHFKPAKNVDIQNFESRLGFTRKLNKMKEYVKPNFFITRANTYRGNIIDSLSKVYNSDATELIGKIQKLSPEQLQWLLLRHPNDFSIDFIYLEELTGKQNLAFLDKIVDEALELQNLKLGR